MCGRTRCTLRVEDVRRACHRTSEPTRTIGVDWYRSSYNVSPGRYMPVVCIDQEACNQEEGAYAVHIMKWGLIPSFTKKTEKPDFFRMFNARSESVSEKASFRRLLPKNRCLVTVDGFYEWKKNGSKKQPYYIHFKDGRPLVFAGLYDSWENSEGETLHTFTIVTTSSSSSLRWLHDRMPVILGSKEATDKWLTSSSYKALMTSYDEPDLVWYPVSGEIGKLSFDGPDCVKEIRLQGDQKGSISKFFSPKKLKKEELAVGDGKNENSDVKVKKEVDGESVDAKVEEVKDESVNVRVKREAEETDSKMAYSLKRVRNVNDNQPSIISYFGRK